MIHLALISFGWSKPVGSIKRLAGWASLSNLFNAICIGTPDAQHMQSPGTSHQYHLLAHDLIIVQVVEKSAPIHL